MCFDYLWQKLRPSRRSQRDTVLSGECSFEEHADTIEQIMMKNFEIASSYQSAEFSLGKGEPIPMIDSSSDEESQGNNDIY
ncbi:unnamed protein product [Hymenolepis diminuta]|uniref:Uncharacterized protein n=1 Tax=Hymenolepis diminuta TaxID=6216 RepID=A0A564YTQ4_HYMDI|nr:unnamed protein product [Hymenolepis diminuta]